MTRQAIIVEGEKCVDAMRVKCPDRITLSWPGGTNSPGKADWSPLAGFDVIIWADHDEPGSKAARQIADTLEPIAFRVRLVDTWAEDPDAFAKGYDAADLIEAGGDPVAHLKAHVRPYIRTVQLEAADGAVQPATTAVLETTSQTVPAVQPAPRATGGPTLAVVDGERVGGGGGGDRPWHADLMFGPNGILTSVFSNHALMVEKHPDMVGVFRLNALSQEVMLCRRPPWDRGGALPRPLRKVDALEAIAWLGRQRGWDGKGPKSEVAMLNAIEVAADRQMYDPLLDYLNGLAWDGTPRVDRWLSTYLFADDTPYHRAIGRRTLIAAVARARRPGCRVDTMLVLEGDQGAKKSSTVSALFSPALSSQMNAGVDNKDGMQQMAGVWGIEMAEMDKVSRASSMSAVKAFLTQPVDRYRPPYGRTQQEFPRRSIIIGTYNPDGAGYLNDPTGLRRFWPVTTGRAADIAGIERDRDQLWAEADALLKAGETWWIDEGSSEDLALFKPQQETRAENDPWANVIVGEFSARSGWVSTSEVWAMLDIPHERRNIAMGNRISRIMHSIGWKRDRHNGYDGYRK